MDHLQQIHQLIVQLEREVRALKSRLNQVSSGSTILSAAVGPHGLLSPTHTDTVPGGAEENMIIIGNASNLWERRSIITVLADLDISSSGSSMVLVLFDASGLTDGVETEFDMPDFFEEDSTRVYLNGMLQRPIIDYNEGTDFDTIVMVAAPAADDELVVEYQAQEAP